MTVQGYQWADDRHGNPPPKYGGPETTVKLYTMHVTIHGVPETTAKLYTMHVTVHGASETTVNQYMMHGTVHGGPLQCFNVVGWARGKASGLQKNWVLVCWW